MKILVVDDEPSSASFLGMALEAEGYEVETCTYAQEAIELAESFWPDFLITDWRLKDSMDGVDVARNIAMIVPEVKIVFVTGMAKEYLKDQARDVNYYEILEKPIDIDEVVVLLRKSAA